VPKRLWHYCSGLSFRPIMESGLLLPQGGGPVRQNIGDAKPAIWLSAQPFWEPACAGSAGMLGRAANDYFSDFGWTEQNMMAEISRRFGLFRIGINPAVSPVINFNEYARTVDPAFGRILRKTDRQMGSNTSRQYLSLRAIYAEEWTAIQKFKHDDIAWKVKDGWTGLPFKSVSGVWKVFDWWREDSKLTAPRLAAEERRYAWLEFDRKRMFEAACRRMQKWTEAIDRTNPAQQNWLMAKWKDLVRDYPRLLGESVTAVPEVSHAA